MTQETKNKLENIDISNMSDEEKRKLILSMRRLGGKGGSQKRPAPTTDDELWEYIKEEIGDEVPRVAVCEDHDAPFDFMRDYYFERERALLVMSSRESGKTRGTAIINYIFAETKPNLEVTTFADIEAQSNKSYTYIKNFVYTRNDNGEKVLKSSVAGDPLRKETNFKNGSKLEVIIGCLPGHAMVHTIEGNKRISEIVSKKLNIDVLTYNFKDDKLEWQKITNWFRNGKGSDWLKFELESSTMQAVNDLYCSKNHELCLPNGEKKKADDFAEGDYLMALRQELSDEQKQICMGMLLGDGAVSVQKLYRVCHALHQMNYLEWFGDSFSEFKPSRFPRPLKNTVDFVTRNSRCFSEMRSQWYPYGEKRIPDFVWDELDVMGLACWLMDDGTWVRGGQKANRVSRVYGGQWHIAAMNFNKHERIKTTQYFEKLGISGIWNCVNAGKDQWIWHTLEDSGVILQSIVADYIDISEKQPKGYKRWIAVPIKEHSVETARPVKIKFIEICSTEQSQYDIEVPPYHNYIISSGIVVGNSKSGVNSPHPQKVHADEIDLMDEEIFYESRSMSSSKILPDGSIIKAQDIATSTRKSNKGLVQKIINEVESAKKHGLKPPWRVYKSCLYETAQEVPNCRTAPKDKREARLKELGRDPCELCECDKVAKGEWAENVPRTLDSVCKGKLFKSRGWMRYDDIVGKFTQNSPNVWVAQLECRRPMADGLYLPTWSRERYVIKDYEPRPEFGYIWMGVDWGGSSASTSAIVWIQGPLHQPIQVNNFQGTKTVIPQGAYVIFREIYEAAIGATRLADKVVRQEIQYRNRYGAAWRVKARFADKAGAQQRADWREHDPPLRTNWYLSGKYFDPTVECVQALVSDSLLYADGTNSPGICDDFESWRSDNGKEVHDESSHGPAACLIAGTKVKTNKGDINIENIKAGDWVHTRKGLKPVEWAGQSGDNTQAVRKVEFSDGSTLVGTDDHPVWVEKKGWVQLAALRYGDIIEGWKNQSSDEKICGTTELNLPDGQNQIISAIKDITEGTIEKRTNHVEHIYTDIFGKRSMVRYLKISMSTMLMKIGTTIQSIILPVLLLQYIYSITRQATNTQLLTGTEKSDQKIFLNQSIGLDRKEKKLEKKLGRIHLRTNQFWIWYARYVKQIIKLRWLFQDSVPVNVRLNGEEIQERTILQKFVQLVGKNLKSANTKLRIKKLVRVSVVAVSEPIGHRFVYDLTVHDAHEFYANGILVHNTRYCLKNVQGIVKRYQGNTRTTLQPVVSARDSAVVLTGALASVNSSPADYSSENWRRSLGHQMPGDNGREGRQPWEP